MLRRLPLPTSRRSTFRAPDPDAAARFDVALPGATADADRRPDAERAELADLRTQSIAVALVEQRLLVEERLAAEVAADRDAAADRAAQASAPSRPQATRASFVPAPSGDETRHPRHRADRIGNRRPTSGPRRTVLAG